MGKVKYMSIFNIGQVYVYIQYRLKEFFRRPCTKSVYSSHSVNKLLNYLLILFKHTTVHLSINQVLPKSVELCYIC